MESKHRKFICLIDVAIKPSGERWLRDTYQITHIEILTNNLLTTINRGNYRQAFLFSSVLGLGQPGKMIADEYPEWANSWNRLTDEKCPICYCKLENKRAFMATCFHQFCPHCLRSAAVAKLDIGATQIQCPICRQVNKWVVCLHPCQMPGGRNRMRPHYELY